MCQQIIPEFGRGEAGTRTDRPQIECPFSYQKASTNQLDLVSEVLGPSIDTRQKDLPISNLFEETIPDDVLANIPIPEPENLDDILFGDTISDDILANIPIPEPG